MRQKSAKCAGVTYNRGNVNCGSHKAKTCSQCPCNKQGIFQGKSWCSGECQWRGDHHNGVCHMRRSNVKCPRFTFNTGNVRCGGHRAKTCSQCPCSQRGVYMGSALNGGINYCNGDCQWRGDHLSGVCHMRRNMRRKGEWHSWNTSRSTGLC